MADSNLDQSQRPADAPYCRADIILALCLLVASLMVYVGEIYTCLNNNTPLCFGSASIPPDFAYLWTISYLQGLGDLTLIADSVYVSQLQTELTGRTEEYVWAYPPHFLFFVRPLSMAPQFIAYVAWVITGLVLLLWSCLSFTRFRLFFLIALILSPAVFANGADGHTGFYTAALLTGGILLAPRRPIIAGILFGLLTFKPHLGLLVPVALVAARLWRPIFSAIITSLCLVVASMVVHGTELWTIFVMDAGDSGLSILRHATGPFTKLMPTIFMAGRILELPEPLVASIQGCAAVAVAVASYLVVRRNSDPIVWVAVVSLGTFLVSPYAYVYDMVIISVATLLLTLNSRQEDLLPFERIVLILLWMLPFLTIHLNMASIPVAPLILSTGFVFIVIKGLRGQRTASPRSLLR